MRRLQIKRSESVGAKATVDEVCKAGDAKDM